MFSLLVVVRSDVMMKMMMIHALAQMEVVKDPLEVNLMELEDFVTMSMEEC